MMCEVVKYYVDETSPKVLATSGGHIALLVKRGNKLLHMILMDSGGIGVGKVPKREERKMEPINYSLAKAKKSFRAAWKKFGGTKEARRHLRA